MISRACGNPGLYTKMNDFLYYTLYQPESQADIGEELIQCMIIKLSCHNLFVKYFLLTAVQIHSQFTNWMQLQRS